MYEINHNLLHVLFGETGYIVGVGYLFIVSFHVSAFIFIFMHFHVVKTFGGLRIVLLSLGIISLIAVGVEKVMYDEVAREYYLEFPMPDETYFIYFGLFINFICIVYALFILNREYKLFESR